MVPRMHDLSQEAYEAVEELLRQLNLELISTIKLRDAIDSHKDLLTLRAMQIEERIAKVAKLEMRLRRST